MSILKSLGGSLANMFWRREIWLTDTERYDFSTCFLKTLDFGEHNKSVFGTQ
jgi:hypothetical protein